MTPKKRSQEEKQEFAELLKSARETLGLVPSEMAARLGIKYYRYWSYENMRNMPQNDEEKQRLEELARGVIQGNDLPPPPEAEEEEKEDNVEEKFESVEEIAEAETDDEEDNSLGIARGRDDAESFEEMYERTTYSSYGYDDRSTLQQLEDLGVEVKKMPKDNRTSYNKHHTPKLKNLKWLKYHDQKGEALDEKISITKSGISLGNKVMEMLKEKADMKFEEIRLQFATAELNGKNVLVIKPDISGYKMTSKRERVITGSSSLSQRIKESGLPFGWYKIEHVTRDGAIIFSLHSTEKE